jgi:hypothetical protein
MLGDVCPASLMPSGLALQSLSWHAGFLIGGAIGGSLAQPSGEFFEDIPYVLPMTIASLMCLAITILFVCGIKETLVPRQDTMDNSSETSFWIVLCDPAVVFLFIAYGISSFVQTSLVDLIPLWCWSNRDHGGLEYDIKKIGSVIMFASIIGSIVQ